MASCLLWVQKKGLVRPEAALFLMGDKFSS